MGDSWLEKVINLIITGGLKLLIGVIALLIIYKLINFTSKKVKKTLEKRKVDTLISKIIYFFINKGLKIVAFILFLGFVGIDTAGIGAAIGSIFVGVGLALQGSLSNLAGGVIILILRPFNLDDYIEVENASGSVESIGIFYTCLRTPDNKIIYVPNGELANNEIVNYDKKETRRIDKIISISYDENFEKIKQILLNVCTSNKQILSSIEPYIVISEYGEYSIKILCRVWVKSSDYFSVFYNLNEQIKTSFEKENIVIPLPILDVNISKK